MVDLPQEAARALRTKLAERGIAGVPLEEACAWFAAGLAQARERYPAIALPPEGFADFALRRLAPGAPVPSGLLEINVPELLVAFGCACGDAETIASFERDFLPASAAAARRLSGDLVFVDEVVQQARVKILVGNPPRIAGFNGRGSLEGWVRTLSLRVALDLKRAGTPAVDASDDILDGLAAPEVSPELLLLKASYRADLKAAFEHALSTLDKRERSVLRLSALEGLSIDEIGAVYGAHRASAARWIVAAREKLLEETRKALALKLGLPDAELDSLLGLLKSHLEVSISRFLQ